MERAQSEIVGEILLVAIVVVAIGIIASFYLGAIGPDSGPSIDATFDADGSDLIVGHAGGDTVPPTELVLVIDHDGERTRVPFVDGTRLRGTGDSVSPGHRWRFDDVFTTDDSAMVWLVHEPSDRVLDRQRVYPTT